MPSERNETFTGTARRGETVEQGTARVVLSPDLGAAMTAVEYARVRNASDVTTLTAELQRQAAMVSTGNLARGEEMLCAQAHVLDQIFGKLASLAIHAEKMPHLEAYLRLGLKAQAQSRACWEAVSAIQNPPLAAVIKQANVTSGPQQINNGSRTRETEKAPTQLLEQTDGNRLDFGTAGTAGRVDPPMEAVEAVNRA